MFLLVAYHFCPNLPEKFSQPGDHLLAHACTATVASDISRLPSFSAEHVSLLAVEALIVKEKMSGKDVPNWAKALDWSKMVMNKENKKEVCTGMQ